MPRLPLMRHPMLYYKSKLLYHKSKHSQAPSGLTIKNIGDVKLPMDLSLGKMIRAMYFDCFDFEIRRIIEKYLKPGDVFFDIGANIGYFTAVGANAVGMSGKVYSFEPIPEYYCNLERIVELNPDYSIIANDFALGENTCQSTISKHPQNVGGSSLLNNYEAEEGNDSSYDIDIKRIDEYVVDENIKRISLIKIDTEGFELPVIKGAARFLDSNKKNLPPIIAEISPDAFKLLGREIEELKDFMLSYGYKSYEICGCHKIDIAKITKQTNVIFKA